MMTIDKTIEFFNGLECHTSEAEEALNVAIDTMKKYQKVERIYQTWNTVNNYSYNQAMQEIGALIGDYKDAKCHLNSIYGRMCYCDTDSVKYKNELS